MAENILSVTGEGGTVSAAAYTNMIPTSEAIDSTDVYNGIGYQNGCYASSASPYEAADSAQDTAFTVVTIDRAGGKIYAWCYGAGYDRLFDIP